jgi:hypothetical protein
MRHFTTRAVLTVGLSLVALGVTADVTSGQTGDRPMPGVLIDFTNLPVLAKADLTIRIEFEGLKYEPKEYHGPTDPEDMAFICHNGLVKSGAKVELVGKTKVRVLGWVKDGKFHRAVKGAAESKTLKAEELPKVTNPGKKL